MYLIFNVISVQVQPLVQQYESLYCTRHKCSMQVQRSALQCSEGPARACKSLQLQAAHPHFYQNFLSFLTIWRIQLVFLFFGLFSLFHFSPPFHRDVDELTKRRWTVVRTHLCRNCRLFVPVGRYGSSQSQETCQRRTYPKRRRHCEKGQLQQR